MGWVAGRAVAVGSSADNSAETGASSMVDDDGAKGGKWARGVQGEVGLPHPVGARGKGDAVDAELGVADGELLC